MSMKPNKAWDLYMKEKRRDQSSTGTALAKEQRIAGGGERKGF